MNPKAVTLKVGYGSQTKSCRSTDWQRSLRVEYWLQCDAVQFYLLQL